MFVVASSACGPRRQLAAVLLLAVLFVGADRIRPRARRAAALLLPVVAEAQLQPRPGETSDVLRRLDTDGDGAVDAGELAAGAGEAFGGEWLELGREAGWLGKRKVAHLHKRLFAASDIDGDGRLNEAEMSYAGFLATLAARDVAERPKKKLQWMRRIGGDLGAKQAATLMKGFDTDGDGSIGEEEFQEEYQAAFGHVFSTWGWTADAMESGGVNDAVRATFRAADITGDARLNPRELQLAAGLMSTYSRGSLASNLLAACDANHDGAVDAVELSNGLAVIVGDPSQGGTQADYLFESFSQIDADGNGRLDEEELVPLAGLILGGRGNN